MAIKAQKPKEWTLVKSYYWSYQRAIIIMALVIENEEIKQKLTEYNQMHGLFTSWLWLPT